MRDVDLVFLMLVFTNSLFSNLDEDNFKPSFYSKYLESFEDLYFIEIGCFNINLSTAFNIMDNRQNSSSQKDGIFYLEYPVECYNCPICP